MKNNIKKCISLLLALLLLASLPLGVISFAADGTEITESLPDNDPGSNISNDIIGKIMSFFQGIVDFLKNLFSNPNGGLFSKKITWHHLSSDAYYQFVENPSADILNNDENWAYPGAKVLTISIFFPEYIKIEPLNKKLYIKSFMGFIEFIVMYFFPEYEIITGDSSFIDFVGDKREIKKFLNENGISDDIEDFCLISSWRAETALWVKTDKANYFITFGGLTTFEIKLYSQNEFFEEVRPKDGKLIVNGEDITSGSYVKIHSRDADLPLMAIAEALGVGIEWKSETIIITTYGSKNNILDIAKPSLICIKADENINIFGENVVLLRAYYYYQIDDGEFILYSGDAIDFLRFITGENIKITINRDELTVYVDIL